MHRTRCHIFNRSLPESTCFCLNFGHLPYFCARVRCVIEHGRELIDRPALANTSDTCWAERISSPWEGAGGWRDALGSAYGAALGWPASRASRWWPPPSRRAPSIQKCQSPPLRRQCKANFGGPKMFALPESAVAYRAGKALTVVLGRAFVGSPRGTDGLRNPQPGARCRRRRRQQSSLGASSRL